MIELRWKIKPPELACPECGRQGQILFQHLRAPAQGGEAPIVGGIFRCPACGHRWACDARGHFRVNLMDRAEEMERQRNGQPQPRRRSPAPELVGGEGDLPIDRSGD